jgi:hypothetical protein
MYKAGIFRLHIQRRNIPLIGGQSHQWSRRGSTARPVMLLLEDWNDCDFGGKACFVRRCSGGHKQRTRL